MYEEEESASMITEKFQNENSDSLSDLPDELIVSILSRLTAKEVPQTCILSKRWRNLWAHVPSICFDILDCNGDSDRYKKFVTNFLLKRDGATATHVFRILCEGLDIEWVNYAVDHSPKIIEMTFTRTAGFYSQYIPKCLFNCKTLEDLTLKVHVCELEEIKPSTVYLPKLTNLNLINVHIGGDNLEKILSGCPILKDLRMEDCALKMSSFSCHSVNGCNSLALKFSRKPFPFLFRVLKIWF